MKRLEAKSIALIFGALITIPVIAFAVGMRPEPNQNRPPTPLPEITVEGIMDRELTPQLDQYLEDSLIIAPTAVAAEAWTDVALGDNPNPEVTIGTDGWLYYTFSLTRPCLSAEDVDAFVDAVESASRVVEATGRKLIVALAPDKATIIPDFLPDETSCVLDNAEALAALDGPTDAGHGVGRDANCTRQRAAHLLPYRHSLDQRRCRGHGGGSYRASRSRRLGQRRRH